MSPPIPSGNGPSPATPPPAGLAEAVRMAVRLLGAARFPVLAGLGTDLDGLRQALCLAERLRGAIDSGTGARRVDMRVLADTGFMTTTPAEARHRADCVVLVGPEAAAYAAEVALFDDAHPLYPWRTTRDVIVIGDGRPNDLGTLPGTVTLLGDADSAPGPILTAIRAALGGRARGPLPDGVTGAAIDAAAATLKGAGFGVVVHDPASLGALGTERLQGLVKDLNAETRFSSLAVPAARGGRIHQIVSAWTTGFPLGLGFGRGYPEFDAWRFDAERLIASSEADALLWIAALGPDLPAWAPRERTIALVPPGTTADAAAKAAIVIEVGVPGLDHGATLYEARRDGFAWMPASAPSDRPSVATVLAHLAAAVDTRVPA